MVDDVVRIRRHPLVPAGIAIYGFVDDVQTGRLVEARSDRRRRCRLTCLGHPSGNVSSLV